MTYKVLIVDDEPLAADIIESHIESSSHRKFEIVGKCSNPIEAGEFLKDKDVDIMFLDINMPRLSGIEFLKILDNRPLTVLTTAHSEYALESYELDVVDYLLKPISKERFDRAVEKAVELLDSLNRDDSNDGEQEVDFIFIKSDKKYIKVFFDDIFLIEGLKDYVLVRLKDRRLIALHTMKSLEEKLVNHDFQRVHRSYIVNMNKVSSIVGNVLELDVNGHKEQVPIGKSYRDNILALIEKNRL